MEFSVADAFTCINSGGAKRVETRVATVTLALFVLEALHQRTCSIQVYVLEGVRCNPVCARTLVSYPKQQCILRSRFLNRYHASFRRAVPRTDICCFYILRTK